MAHRKQQSRSKSLALFDIELDDTDGSGFTASDVLREVWTQMADCSSADQLKLTDDAQRARMLALSPSGEVSLERFAQVLAMHDRHVWLRTGKLECCFGHVALRHTFVLAGSGSDVMPELFVVDPCFKEQFQLPNATPEYQALWQNLPNLFVGTADQLVPVVELMCTQMQRVFADTATSCPPWRTPSCMLTKWLPHAADDVSVAAPGSSDADSSSRPSSSNTNSTLSSPAALRQTSSISLLAPIRTTAPHTAAGLAEPTDALTPRSARSPLYYDQQHYAARKGLLSPGSPGEAEEAAECAYGPAGGARHALVVHWGPQDNGEGLDVPAGHLGDESCFMASGSWGLGTLASTISSPSCDVPWDLLRSCRSEDVFGRVHNGPRAHAMAIGRRAPFKVDQGRGGNGFADALVGRSRLGLLGGPAEDVVAMPEDRVAKATGPHNSSSKGVQPVTELSDRGYVGAYRSRSAASNPTLDISRFDRNSHEDASPEPLAWGLGPERFGSTSSIGGGRKLSATSGSSKPVLGAGAMCPPAVKRRNSSSSSQCSALSAAIAGKGVAIR